SNRTSELLGCSLQDFKLYIESLWTKGMNWNNYGKFGWHLDHIQPCASFDLTDPSQQKKCFHYSNIQPLWAKDNWSKGSR
ncbi:MAG: HNH endonuclease, partial [Chitinophagia bacterium]|nr:HNH endonuclease [Chitinophagia bacterium]